MGSDDSLTRTLLIVIAAILLLPVLMMALAMPIIGLWGGGHMWNGNGTSWTWLVMSAVPLLVVLGIGYLLYSAVRRPDGKRMDPAVEELRAAYARGDLSDEEFEKRSERLRRNR